MDTILGDADVVVVIARYAGDESLLVLLVTQRLPHLEYLRRRSSQARPPEVANRTRQAKLPRKHFDAPTMQQAVRPASSPNWSSQQESAQIGEVAMLHILLSEQRSLALLARRVLCNSKSLVARLARLGAAIQEQEKRIAELQKAQTSTSWAATIGEVIMRTAELRANYNEQVTAAAHVQEEVRETQRERQIVQTQISSLLFSLSPTGGTVEVGVFRKRRRLRVA